HATDGGIHIWVTISHRNSHSVTVDTVILPSESHDEIDAKYIAPTLRKLALRLFVESGQVKHIGDSPERLGDFLLGIEASAHHHWWQAIYHYRRSLHAMEASHGFFSLGHYHLGAALVYQGNWEDGL